MVGLGAFFDINLRFIYQYLAMISGNLILICSGMHYGWPSPYLSQLLDANSTVVVITNDEGFWIAVMPVIGAAIGAVISVFVVDVIGRRKTVLISCFPYCVTWIMVAFSKSAIIFIVARLLCGITDGVVYCALPMYLAEISDRSIRGAIGSSVIVAWFFGTLLINIMGAHLSICTAALIASTVPILCFLTFYFMPESPYHLIIKGDIQQAKKNLEKLKGDKNIESDFQRINEGVQEQQKRAGRWLDIFTVKSNRNGLILIAVLRLVQQFSGSSAITFYAKSIFQQEDSSGALSSSDCAIIYFSIQLVFCTFGSAIIDKTGRKVLLIISTIGSCFALLLEALYFFALKELDVNLDNFSWVSLVGLATYIIFFSLGLLNIPVLVSAEIFPTNVKALGMCLGEFNFGISATIVSKIFQHTKDYYGLHYSFFIFFLCSLSGLIYIIFFLPETKGLSLEEIQDLLKGRDKSKQRSNVLATLKDIQVT